MSHNGRRSPGDGLQEQQPPQSTTRRSQVRILSGASRRPISGRDSGVRGRRGAVDQAQAGRSVPRLEAGNRERDHAVAALTGQGVDLLKGVETARLRRPASSEQTVVTIHMPASCRHCRTESATSSSGPVRALRRRAAPRWRRRASGRRTRSARREGAAAAATKGRWPFCIERRAHQVADGQRQRLARPLGVERPEGVGHAVVDHGHALGRDRRVGGDLASGCSRSSSPAAWPAA